MIDTTHRLQLPYIVASQAQKEVTHNDALDILDVLVQASAIAVEDTPPADPKSGDRYIVGAKPTGVWDGHTDALAYYTNGWNFIASFEGLTVWVRKTRCHYTYDGKKWQQSSTPLSESL